jgi:hypothetical protein
MTQEFASILFVSASIGYFALLGIVSYLMKLNVRKSFLIATGGIIEIIACLMIAQIHYLFEN